MVVLLFFFLFSGDLYQTMMFLKVCVGQDLFTAAQYVYIVLRHIFAFQQIFYNLHIEKPKCNFE